MSGSKILLVDDHPVVRKGLREFLAEYFSPVVFGEAANGLEAIELVREGDWDAVLLDINLPGCGGLEVLQEVKAMKPELPVLIVSMFEADQFALRALQLGASSCIRKDSAGPELLAAVAAALRKRAAMTGAADLKPGLRLDEGVPHMKLTGREYQVFCLLGSGMPAREVARQLSLSIKSVSTYRKRALKRLGLTNTAEIVGYLGSHRMRASAVVLAQ